MGSADARTTWATARGDLDVFFVEETRTRCCTNEALWVALQVAIEKEKMAGTEEVGQLPRRRWEVTVRARARSRYTERNDRAETDAPGHLCTRVSCAGEGARENAETARLEAILAIFHVDLEDLTNR